jgi:lipopolysaccharide export system permease protein
VTRVRATPGGPKGAGRPRQVSTAVLTIIDRYLLRQIVTTSLVMTGIALAILLLDRVLHLFALVANPNKAFSYVGQMLVLMLPHFLSIALPAAFFFGILLTFLRLKRDCEFVIMAGMGRSLARLLAPVMGLAIVVAALTALIVGWVSPHARYGYRALKQQVAEASLTAAVRGGTFIHAGHLTFFADHSAPAPDGLRLAKVFVYQEQPDGSATAVTGQSGRLGQIGTSQTPLLILQQGERAELPVTGRPSTVTFANLSWPVVTGSESNYRPRGLDQRELTLDELWNRPASASSEPSAAEIAAELHARLVLIASVPILPLLAAPLALIGGPRSQRSGLAIGLLILVMYYQALNFGEALAKRDLMAAGIGLWLPFVALAAGAGWLFLRHLLRGRPRRSAGAAQATGMLAWPRC